MDNHPISATGGLYRVWGEKRGLDGEEMQAIPPGFSRDLITT